MQHISSKLLVVGLSLAVGQLALGDERPRSAPVMPPITVQRLLLDQDRIAPVQFKSLGAGHYFVDFGRAAFAGLELIVPNPEPRRTVRVHLGERLAAPGQVHRKPGGSIRYHVAEVTLQAGQTVYRVPLTPADARLMPAEIGPVMPFRYVELENAPDGWTADHLRQLAAHYPFDDAAAAFSCSDPKLNAIWELSRYTMKATSFGGLFVDGDRERKAYEADAYINQLGWYCTTTDTTLPRYTHEYLITHPTWPTEWILFSVLMAWEDYQQTGDATSLRAFYPELQAKTLQALARPDGLISTEHVPDAVSRAIHIKGIRDIVDWPPGERDGYEMMPVNTVVNAFYCHALDRMAKIADAVGNAADAEQYRRAADRAKTALNTLLVDGQTGLYVDGLESRHSSLHANMFPLAFGLVPAERQGGVTAFVRSRRMACSVYGAQFLLEALFDHGQAEHAIALMTADNDRSWTHMVERVGTTMTLEAWDDKYKPNQDWNHAWGAAPANILPRKLMGIEPLTPGYRQVRIRPQPGGLTQAAVTMPTPRGAIQEAWTVTPGQFVMTLTLPAGTTATVHLPVPAGLEKPRVLVDGVERAGMVQGGAVVIHEVAAGTHRLEVRGR